MKPSSLVYLLAAAVFIFILWFGMGFLIPLYYKPPTTSGEFGDGFGSVNALFGGLSILALTYTIMLQIENSERQKKQERFALVIKLIDDSKNDLNNFEYHGHRGMAALLELQRRYVLNGLHIFDQIYITYLVCVVNQLKNTMDHSDLYFKNEEGYRTLVDKIGVLYITYLLRLGDTIYPMTFEKNDVSGDLRDELIALSNLLFPDKNKGVGDLSKHPT